MRSAREFTVLLACFFGPVVPVLAQEKLATGSPAILMQEASYLKTTVGDVAAASELYSQVLGDESAPRALRAHALYRLGLCSRRAGTGLQTRTEKVFKTLIAEYPEQVDLVARCRLHLAELQRIVCRQIPRSVGEVSPDEDSECLVDWDEAKLVLLDRTTGERRVLTPEGTWKSPDQWPEEPCWAPDGNRIGYTWHQGGRPDELRFLELDNGAPRTLFQAPGSMRVAGWAASSSVLLAVHREVGVGSRQLLVSVEDRSTHVIQIFPGDRPRWHSLSPDGRHVVYDLPQEPGSSNRDLFTCAVRGGRPIRVVSHAAHDFSALWTPDDRWIVFLSDRTGVTSLQALPVSDGVPQGAERLLMDNLGDVRLLSFSNDGALLYRTNHRSLDVWSVSLEVPKAHAESTRIPSPIMGNNSAPDWSPDGKRLAYVSRRTSKEGGGLTSGIIVLDLKTGNERRLTGAGTPIVRPDYTTYQSGPEWSPDGTALLVSRAPDAGGCGLWIVDARTGDVLREVPSPRPLRSALWSVDGDRIFFWRDGVLHGFELASGRRREIYRAETGAFCPERGGSRVVIATAQAIVSVPIEGGEAETLWRADASRPIDALAGIEQDPVTGDLFFCRQAGDRTEVWQLPDQGGEARALGLSENGLGGLSFDSSRRRLAYHARSENLSVLWRAENLMQELRE